MGTAKKEAWREAAERETARYYATPGGAATKAFYEAAEKTAPAMARELGACGAEVVVETYNGETTTYLVFEAENREREEFVFPAREWARGKAWLAKFAARKGWRFTEWYAAP